jgi:hypothetical protein
LVTSGTSAGPFLSSTASSLNFLLLRHINLVVVPGRRISLSAKD